MIGTHLAYVWVQLAAFIPVSLLFGLEAWTTIGKLSRRYPLLKSKDYSLTLTLCLWLLLSGLVLMLPTLVQNYHSAHHTAAGEHSHDAREHNEHGEEEHHD
jgi:hypothetical protein